MTTEPVHTATPEQGLSLLREQVRRALESVKARCSPAGVFDPALLDGHQAVCYELAFCSAELQALEVLCRHGDRLAGEDPLLADLVPAYGAELLQSVWQRLASNAADMGLEREVLAALITDSPLVVFLAANQRSEKLADIGTEIMRRGVFRLPTGLDEEKELVRETFARFAREEVAPMAEEIHRQDLDIPESIIAAAAELGCFGTSIPERFGGLMPDERPDSLGMIVVTEELSTGSLCAAGSLITRPEIVARALLSGGTDEQQARWLPRLASGSTLAAIAITEPNYGSDVASVSVRATPREGGWLLNGSKTWCTFAGRADLLHTLARTEPDPSLGHRGLSLFLVEKPACAGHQFDCEQPGGGTLSGRAIATIGYRGMHSFDLFFEDYFVPADNLVGGARGQGQGFYYAMAGFSGGRIQTAARATGVMQAALDQAIRYAAERHVFGAPVGDFQFTRVKLARMLGALTASRHFSYAVAALMDEGKGQMEASLVKLFACRAVEWVTREAMQIHGGMGYAEESAVSRYFVDARVLSIFEGTEETLALKVIARDLVSKAGEAG